MYEEQGSQYEWASGFLLFVYRHAHPSVRATQTVSAVDAIACYAPRPKPFRVTSGGLPRRGRPCLAVWDRSSALASSEASLPTRLTNPILAFLQVRRGGALSLEWARRSCLNRSAWRWSVSKEGAQWPCLNRFSSPVACPLAFTCGFYTAAGRKSATLASVLVSERS